MKFSVSRRPNPTIDVTPMIDIVFQLVLFFMVSTTFVSAPGIEVELPKSSSTAMVEDKLDINIWVAVDGMVLVNDEPVTSASLAALLKQEAQRDESALVIIKADTGVSHGRVVSVMDQVKSAGLSRLAIATSTEDKATDNTGNR
jgi:biopolymer transport protein ExbD